MSRTGGRGEPFTASCLTVSHKSDGPSEPGREDRPVVPPTSFTKIDTLFDTGRGITLVSGTFGLILFLNLLWSPDPLQAGHQQESPGPLTALLAATLGAAAFSLMMRRIQTLRRNRRRREQRRRAVQEAEQALENNLRGSLTVAIPKGGDRIYVLPQPTSPASGEKIEGQGKAPAEEAPHLALAQLWAVTHRRLDHYHTIALEQSQKAFRNAQGAMATGFLLLAGCVIVAVTAASTAGAVAAGSLGAVAAGLAGYIAHTFVRSQEAAAAHLRTYFDQPVEFSRYLAAERLVAESTLTPQQREELVAVLVRAMVAGQYGPTLGGSA